MPAIWQHVAARLAFWHATGVYRRFQNALARVEHEQERALRATLTLVRESDFGRAHDLRLVRCAADLRRAVPIRTYEDYRPWIERVWHGQTEALFHPAQRVLMFATSSGTTAKPKYIPVTPQFVRDYRRGWNTFGVKLLADHPQAILRPILQASGRPDERYSPAGIPCGAITGLLARAQKRIVRRFYVGRPEVACLSDVRARYYTLMRLGVVRDVAFAITANPATLIQMARTAAEASEQLIRDVRDGTLSPALVPDTPLRERLRQGLRPDAARAAELERSRQTHGVLRPRDYWRLVFVACWTGGSMGHYLDRLREWYGDVPVRDVGLLASEGRVSIPLEDNTPAGVLDVRAALFEFIPVAAAEKPDPPVLWATEVEEGGQYIVVLSNASGLLRYRLDDVVRVRGFVRRAPVVEFLHRAGRVASVAGEKLTENHAVEAMRTVCARLNLTLGDFVLAPCWDDPPYYRLSLEAPAMPAVAAMLDEALGEQNEEYRSRRRSGRLGPLRVRALPSGTLARMDRALIATRGSTAEQYKRPCLFTDPSADDALLNQSDV